jgi:selenocysteine lyase/cysteine desulfurase
VHYAPHAPIDVANLGIDVLLCSPYKFFGPHLGLAYGRDELLRSWRPYKVRPEGAVRAGFVHYNTVEEVDRLLAALAEL